MRNKRRISAALKKYRLISAVCCIFNWRPMKIKNERAQNRIIFSKLLLVLKRWDTDGYFEMGTRIRRSRTLESFRSALASSFANYMTPPSTQEVFFVFFFFFASFLVLLFRCFASFSRRSRWLLPLLAARHVSPT
jgi:hypothetical protein